VAQLVLHLHEVAAEPPHATAEAAADPAVAESTIEPLHATADPIAAGATPTKTSCLCVRV
jgi:hypothetical protein